MVCNRYCVCGDVIGAVHACVIASCAQDLQPLSLVILLVKLARESSKTQAGTVCFILSSGSNTGEATGTNTEKQHHTQGLQLAYAISRSITRKHHSKASLEDIT